MGEKIRQALETRSAMLQFAVTNQHLFIAPLSQSKFYWDALVATKERLNVLATECMTPEQATARRE
jgi:hypothetical protein